MKFKINFINTLYFFFIFTLLLFIAACNPSGENLNRKFSKNTHSVKPLSGSVYHGVRYRFPYGSCDNSSCHGADLKGGISGGISCLTCHDDQWSVFAGTHTSNINGRFHHSGVENGGFTAACGISGCHGNGSALYSSNNTGYNFRYSCYTCHNPIPGPGHRYYPPFSTVAHAINFRFPHTSGNCTSCHGVNLDGIGGSATTSCYNLDCHSDLWSVFPGESSATHTDNREGYYHHSGDNSVCATSSCHGTSLHGVSGYNFRYSCYVCHNPIPD